MVEIESSPGDSTPMHVHQNEDEHFVIVEGTARIALGDAIFDAAAGTSITPPQKYSLMPGAMPQILHSAWCHLHTWWRRRSSRLIAQGGNDIDLLAIAKKSGVQIVGSNSGSAQKGAPPPARGRVERSRWSALGLWVSWGGVIAPEMRRLSLTRSCP